jgi:hypothetical protein
LPGTGRRGETPKNKTVPRDAGPDRGGIMKAGPRIGGGVFVKEDASGFRAGGKRR